MGDKISDLSISKRMDDKISNLSAGKMNRFRESGSSHDKEYHGGKRGGLIPRGDQKDAPGIKMMPGVGQRVLGIKNKG